jgi:endonuclease/exonuclease/phosphatase (EEP) superfamily protein YafD
MQTQPTLPSTSNPNTSTLHVAQRHNKYKQQQTTQSKTITNSTTVKQKAKKENDSSLKVIQININGLANKALELAQLIKENEADIITIQETKLNTKSKAPSFPGFTLVRKDRLNKTGGGLATLVKDTITFTEIYRNKYHQEP